MHDVSESKTESTVAVLRGLLERCLESLDTKTPEFERDYETAVEKDAALVVDIRSAMAS